MKKMTILLLIIVLFVVILSGCYNYHCRPVEVTVLKVTPFAFSSKYDITFGYKDVVAYVKVNKSALNKYKVGKVFRANLVEQFEKDKLVAKWIDIGL